MKFPEMLSRACVISQNVTGNVFDTCLVVSLLVDITYDDDTVDHNWR